MQRDKSIIICTNYRLNPNQPSCAAQGSLDILTALQQAIAEQQLSCHIETFQCLSRCHEGPALRLLPGGRFFTQVTIADIPQILRALQNQ